MTLITVGPEADAHRERIRHLFQKRKAMNTFKRYDGPYQNTLAVVTHGSHLYGMATEASDTDLKVIFLPTVRQLLMCQQPKVTRIKYLPDGTVSPTKEALPPGSYEIEWNPVHKFVADFMDGQSWATEVAFGVVQGFAEPHRPPIDNENQINHIRWNRFHDLCTELVINFRHGSVKSMADFAVKQTFDYVKRGQRYNEVLAVKEVLSDLRSMPGMASGLRLDTKIGDGITVLDMISVRTGIPIGSSPCNTGTQRTLNLCGRQYLETVKLFPELWVAITRLADEYGERSKRAAMDAFDWKSMSHAVRVYEQIVEYLTQGVMTFPRRTADHLIQIKKGEVPIEQVQAELLYLDGVVDSMIAGTTLRGSTEDLKEKASLLLYKHMREWLSFDTSSLPPESNSLRHYADCGSNL